MDRPNKYLDIAVLLMLFYTSAIAINRHIANVGALSVSNYIGIVLLISVIILKLAIPTKFRLSVFLLLALGLFNIVSFTYYKTTAGVNYGERTAEIDLINPLILVLIIIYMIVNRRFIRRYYTPSNKEEVDQQSKMVGFYFDKFNSCSEEELKNALSLYDQYPLEAQLALRKVHDERQFNILKLT